MAFRHWLARPVAVAVSACFTPAWSNPTGPQVVSGAASFARPDARTLNVTNSPGAIINWQGFSIGGNEVTRFIQQSASSAVLNRVVGADISRLQGQLLSNGRVFLVNPAGIVIGPGAVVDTAGFVASTLNLTDADFLAGKLRFQGDGTEGSIVNQGWIRAAAGGNVILVAPNVENAGLIEAPGGALLLAAGRKLTIGSTDMPGVQFEIQAPADSVVNVGKLIADGGAVGVFAGTLRHSGEIRANALVRDEAGRVVLKAQGNATLAAGSTTTASGKSGGSITIQSGGTTAIAGEVAVTANAGRGGDVQVLGERVDVASDATVRADASAYGEGGRIVVRANDEAHVHGSLSARGAGGAKGGFVETSARNLEVTRAPSVGAGGTWLLDPLDLEVVDQPVSGGGLGQISNRLIAGELAEGVNVVLDTNTSGGQDGNITVNAPIVQASTIFGASLTLNATNSVTINADIILGAGDLSVKTTSPAGAMSVNSATVRASGAMNLELAGALLVQTTNGSDAILHAAAGQTIAARSVVVSSSGSGTAAIANDANGQFITVNNAAGGSGIDVVSIGNGAARISNAIAQGGSSVTSPGPQIISVFDGDRLQVLGERGEARIESGADQSVALFGGGANRITIGAATAGGSSVIESAGSQFVTAGAGGIALAGGSGSGSVARIAQTGSAGSQTITVHDGGSIVLEAGPNAGAFNEASITAQGELQTIHFTSGGSLTLVGGIAGNSNAALVSAANAQDILFTTEIGEASDVTSLNGSFSRATALSSAPVGAITLIAGSRGNRNDAIISSGGAQTIAGFPDVTLIGGDGAGNPGNIAAILSGVSQDFTLGALQLTGGAGRPENVASIEAPVQTIRTAGDVSLSGGDAAGSRIGQPEGFVGGGDVSIVAGGNIVLAGTPQAAGEIRTGGNVNLHADSPGKSISQAAESSIVAHALNASADAGISLEGANQVSSTTLATSGNILLSYGQSVTLDSAFGIATPAGAQSITIKTTGDASDINLIGTFTGGDDHYSLLSGRDILFAGGSSVSAASLTLGGGGRARFESGVVTLNTPVTANLPVEVSGAAVDFNATTVLNNGLALSGGALRGAGDIAIAGGSFLWSGGALSGAGSLFTPGTSNVTGPVSLDTRTFNNSGTVNQTGPSRIDVSGNATINNQAGATWNLSSTSPTALSGNGTFNNAGTLNNNAGAVSRTLALALNNTGRIDLLSGALILPSFPTNAGAIVVNAGTTLSTGGAALLNTGRIAGSGTVDLGGASGATLTNGGIIAPGISTASGTLAINGNFTQTPPGTLAIDIGGTTPGVTHDVLQVNGAANLGGTLDVNYANGFTPSPGDVFSFLTYAGSTGNFAISAFPSGTPTLPGTAGATTYLLALPPPFEPATIVTAISGRVADDVVRNRGVIDETLEALRESEKEATALVESVERREGLRIPVQQCN